jgi:hypothetical protein
VGVRGREDFDVGLCREARAVLLEKELPEREVLAMQAPRGMLSPHRLAELRLRRVKAVVVEEAACLLRLSYVTCLIHFPYVGAVPVRVLLLVTLKH